METKLKLIHLLEENPNGIHLRELSRKLETGMPNLLRYLNLLEKEEVIMRKKDGNLVKVKLKNSIKTLAYLKQLNAEKFLMLPKKVQLALTDFLNELTIKPLIVLIFGSYAKKTNSENSDIDLLLVYQNLENEKEIENTAKRISMRTNLKISPVYLDYNSFEKNFLDKNHAFSGEIRQNVIILFGIELYYQLLWRFLE